MIAVYRDHNLYKKQFAKVVNSASQSGLLVSPKAGRRIVIDDYSISIMGADNADLVRTYNIVLVTCNASGTPVPAPSTVTPLSKLYKLIPLDSTVGGDRYQLQDFWQGRTEVPEGFGVGWYCFNETLSGLHLVVPDSINIRISTHFEAVPSRDSSTAVGTVGTDVMLQPNGGGN